MSEGKFSRDILIDLWKYLPSYVIPALAGIVFLPVITRYLPPDEYGRFQIVMTTTTVFLALSNWIGMAIIRFFARHEQAGTEETIYGTSLYGWLLTTGTLMVVFAAVVVVFWLCDPSLIQGMLIGGLLVVVQSLYALEVQYFRMRRRLGEFNLFWGWLLTGKFVLGVVFVILIAQTHVYPIWGAVVSVVLVLPLLLWRSRQGVRSTLHHDGALLKEMWAYGFPLAVGNVGNSLLSLSDRYVLKFILGDTEVGLYSSGFTVCSRSLLLIVTLFVAASGPLIMKLWETAPRAQIRRAITTLTRYYILIVLPLVFGMTLLSKPVIRLLLAEKYFASYTIIPFIAFATFFLGLQQRMQMGYLLRKETMKIVTLTLVMGIVNVLLNVATVGHFGFVAAAANQTFCYVLLAVLMALGSMRRFYWSFPWKCLVVSTVASVVAMLPSYLWVLPHLQRSISQILAAVVVSGGVYLLLVYLAGELKRPSELKV